jgi:hypothetical protein
LNLVDNISRNLRIGAFQAGGFAGLEIRGEFCGSFAIDDGIFSSPAPMRTCWAPASRISGAEGEPGAADAAKGGA